MHEYWRRLLRAVRAAPRALRAALFLLAFIAAAAVAAMYGREPSLSHVKVAILSGSEQGNYYAVVSRVAAQVQRERGRVENVASAGSIENIQRLSAARASCKIQFALVQDGLPWPASHPFELLGRLPKPESFIVLSRDAERIRSASDLRGMRAGIGPAGSGTEHVARQVMAQLAELDIKVATHPLHEQLALLERGELDLGAMVIDRDAKLMTQAMRERKLGIVDIGGVEALARYLPSARTGVIKAGYYDPVRVLPPADKRVIEIDTLLIGNGCARESVTQGLITAFVRVFPDFVAVNRDRPNLTGLDYASAARSYFSENGPSEVGQYAPWVIDIMPMARWVQLAFAFSLLFAAQAFWHRFRLWRLDALRVGIEAEIAQMFRPGITVHDLEDLAPDPRHRTPEARARIDAVLQELTRLAKRCRRHSLSMLVPMGHEMMYRYQEHLIADWMHALRAFRRRLDQ
ncbi:MAG: hypothetical protein IT518_06015 [Burkholderiales bacterium]|nr:hypothetical protein [Burkholderiales bacterium]